MYNNNFYIDAAVRGLCKASARRCSLQCESMPLRRAPLVINCKLVLRSRARDSPTCFIWSSSACASARMSYRSEAGSCKVAYSTNFADTYPAVQARHFQTCMAACLDARHRTHQTAATKWWNTSGERARLCHQLMLFHDAFPSASKAIPRFGKPTLDTVKQCSSDAAGRT